jgi:hypothetical protein
MLAPPLSWGCCGGFSTGEAFASLCILLDSTERCGGRPTRDVKSGSLLSRFNCRMLAAHSLTTISPHHQ